MSSFLLHSPSLSPRAAGSEQNQEGLPVLRVQDTARMKSHQDSPGGQALRVCPLTLLVLGLLLPLGAFFLIPPLLRW